MVDRATQTTVTQGLSFDAFGQRRNTNWTSMTTNQLLGFDTSNTRRGYTGHEHMDETGLIHMNGRVYDPLLGRFLSADRFVQAPRNTQSFNRYSYVVNNPLSYTDPSGFEFVLLNVVGAFFVSSVALELSYHVEQAIKSIFDSSAAIPGPESPGVATSSFKDGSASAPVFNEHIKEVSSYASAQVATVGLTDNRHDQDSSFANGAQSLAFEVARELDLTPEEALELSLDIAGTIDPTGVVDATHAAILVSKGDNVGAGLVAAGVVPYVGDLAKIAKWFNKLGPKRFSKLLAVLRGRSTSNNVAIIPSNPSTSKSARSQQLAKNKAAGDAFEAKVMAEKQQTQTGVVQQVTVKTKSGTKTRIDLMGRDASGNIVCTECKASATAPLTKNQKTAFPEIRQSGGIVVGKGKPGFPGGTKVPPTRVNIVRP